MSNIVKFPESRITRDRSDDIKADEIVRQKHMLIERHIDRYGHSIMQNLHKNGYDIDSQEFLDDFIFAMESLKSCMMRNAGLYHPLQMIRQKIEEFTDTDS